MFPNVSIIILNWNGWRDIIECLESIYQIDYPNYDVILVDNASKDNSIEKIRNYFGGKIKVKSDFFDYIFNNEPIKIIEYTKEESESGEINEKEVGIESFPPNKKLILIKNVENFYLPHF